MKKNELYYLLRPYLPWRLRMTLRRIVARRQRRYSGKYWPINPGAAQTPADWPGWPEGKKFALVLTHDVEGQKGLNNCRQLMAVEQELGFRSSFNFIPQGEYSVSAGLREELAREGFEVGVHDLHHDGKLYRTRRDFSAKATQINRYLKEWGVRGFRSGFMHHDLEWLAELNILYDASTFDTDPFEPQSDGAHTIFPFWVNGPGGGGYVELPYTLPQDSTMFILFQERNIDIWKKKFDWVVANGGMVLVNVHPDYVSFDGRERGDTVFPVAYYQELLKYAREKYGDTFWHPLPAELAEWFRGNRKLSQPLKEFSSNPAAIKSSVRLKGKRAAVVLYSDYPSDPRPRRALEALAECGMQMDLICIRENPDQPAREQIGPIRVSRLPIVHKRGGKLRYFREYASFMIRAAWLLTTRSFRARYDLVHVHNMPDVLVVTALVPKLLGAKLILDLHDPMPELYQSIYDLDAGNVMIRLLRRLERLSIGFVHLAITPNQAFRRVFCSRSCPAEKMQIVMNTPDEEIFRPKPALAASGNGSKRDGKFRVMYHGLIVERHGLSRAIEAVGLLAQDFPNLVLEIYGKRNTYLDRLESQAAEQGLAAHVRYCGWRRLEEIPPAILAADLGIIPNALTPFTKINFPTRIFEYLSLGKPVIVPDTEGIRDYFNESQILFFEPENSKDLARCIRWVCENPELSAGQVERGRQIYREHLWSLEKPRFVKMVESLFPQ